jgi:glutaredoxin 2
MHDQSLTLSDGLNFASEEFEIAKKNSQTSLSMSGKKLAKVWVKWEETSMPSSSKVVKLVRRLFNTKLFTQQIYSLILKMSHQ